MQAVGNVIPDVTALYTGFRSIFSHVLANADDDLRLRWMTLENSLNLPYIVSFPSMRQVARLVQGELSYLVLQ
eukprot:12904641-Prorocentrum_lima.AAC.1